MKIEKFNGDYDQLGLAVYPIYIEKEAIKREASALYADVSITAGPFFEKQGFKTLKQQRVSFFNKAIVDKMFFQKQRP